MAEPAVDVGALLAKARDRAAKEPQRLQGKKGTYELNIVGAKEPAWSIAVGDPPALEVRKGKPAKPARARLRIEARDFERIAKGEINAKMAFIAGKVDVTGDLEFAMQLQELLA